MIEIDSPEKLEAWLKDKPPVWSASIALRILLRMLPLVSNPSMYKSNVLRDRLTIAVLRCATLSWVTGAAPTYDIAVQSDISSASTVAIADAAAYAAYAAADAPSCAAIANAAAYAAYAATAADSATAASYVTAAVKASGEIYPLWHAVSGDCTALASAESDPEPALSLLTNHLWHYRVPGWFDTDWAIARKTLSDSADNFDVWIDWLQRRIDGSVTGFELPFNDDAEIGRRLIEASNEWWNRGPAAVNAEVRAWLSELTPKIGATPTREPNDANFFQNPRALIFGADSKGRIDLVAEVAGYRVLRGADAQDRHAETMTEAKAALAASARDLSQAFAIADTISDYLQALGDSLETLRPSQLVLRGDKLRRLRADHLSPTSSRPPLSEAQAFALENWERAHSALVGIDPFLSSIERASYGPNVPATIISLDAIKAIIDSARNANIATVGAQAAITDAVENVPADAPVGERRFVLATESLKNFIRGTAGFIRQHKGKFAVSAVGLAKGAHEAALWIQRNIEWLRDVFGGERSVLDLVNWIASLPL